MADRLHLSPKHRRALEALLRTHLPHVEVWAYGSRVTGRSHDGSDLDLALRGPKLEKIPADRLEDFEEAVRESNIPFLVEAHDWARLPERFHHEIERDHVVLWERNQSYPAGDGWKSLRIGDVCIKIGSGATPRGGKEVYLKEGPFSLIRSQNIHNDHFSRGGLAFISEKQATELNNAEVLHDDVLLNITGDSVARACQVPPDVLPARVNQHVAIIRPDSRKLSARFLRYFLVTPEPQTKLLSWAGSGGTRNALTKGMIESLEVQAPPDIAEQDGIAHVLGTLDDKIELNRQMSETLEAMVRALFQSWFVDFDPVRAKMEGRDTGLPPHLAHLFPDRLVDSELGLVPEGWEVGELGDYIEAVKGVSYKGSGLRNNGMPLHNLNSIHEGGGYKYDGIKYYTGEHRERHLVQPGDLIVANTEQGHDRLLIGYAAIIPYLFGECGIASHHVFRIRPKSNSPLTTGFLCHLFNSAGMHDVVSRYANGTTVNMLPVDGVLRPKIVRPPKSLVTAFSSLVSKACNRGNENVSESIALASCRDSLLPLLVSGKLRIGKISSRSERADP